MEKRKLIEYYDEGWRYGYIVDRKIDDAGNGIVKIEKILPIGVDTKKLGTRARFIRVKEDDTREVTK